MHRLAPSKAFLVLSAFAVIAAGCGGSDEGGDEGSSETSVPASIATTDPVQSATTSSPPTVATTSPSTTTSAPSATTVPLPTTQAPATPTTVADGTVITIGDLFFRPNSTTVAVGDTVTWQQDGDLPHTTTAGIPGARSDLWHSGTMSTGDTFSMTFDTAGTFQYFCSIHPNDMQATITVTDG